MTLTRKHFKKLAWILGVTNANSNTIREIVSFCENENDLFDEELFRLAIDEARTEDIGNYEESEAERRAEETNERQVTAILDGEYQP